MISKLPESYWKKMRFCILNIIHTLDQYESKYTQCAQLLTQAKKIVEIIKEIPFIEWKIGFHFQIKCEESGETVVNEISSDYMSKKDYEKLRFLYKQLLFLVRTCSEKSFERTYVPGLELAKIRSVLLEIRDEMSEGLKIIDNLPYQDNGVKYTYSIESGYGMKPHWSDNR